MYVRNIHIYILIHFTNSVPVKPQGESPGSKLMAKFAPKAPRCKTACKPTI